MDKPNTDLDWESVKRQAASLKDRPPITVILPRLTPKELQQQFLRQVPLSTISQKYLDEFNGHPIRKP